MYPKFTSYSKNVELKEIFENIDYRGGYMMQGNKFIADGGKHAEAKIVFKKNGKNKIIKVNEYTNFFILFLNFC